MSKALAHVGMRVLTDAAFLARVRLDSFLRPFELEALNRSVVSFRSTLRLKQTRRRGNESNAEVVCVLYVCVTRCARKKL